MATGQVPDPFNNFNFHVELDGISRAAFQQCTGFDSSIEVVEHREGGNNITPRKFPGLNKFSNIQLKWGMTDDMDLYDWHQQILDGDIVRKNGSIVLLDRRGQTVARWEFTQAFPVKYDAPDLNAEKSEIAIEMMELAHEGLKRTV
jgi:phage tail-like protein